jgi:hypothetical protein
MPALAGRERRALFGEIALRLPTVHERNISVALDQINKSVVLGRLNAGASFLNLARCPAAAPRFPSLDDSC